MNNIFLNNDPLLMSSTNNTPFRNPQFQMPYNQVMLQQMQQMQQPIDNKDMIEELDNKLKNVSEEILANINQNEEWNMLNAELSGDIHKELISIIKNRLINNPKITSNIKRQLDIINDAEKKQKEFEKQSLNEVSDYLKNYSHLTFDEYKKLKNEHID